MRLDSVLRSAKVTTVCLLAVLCCGPAAADLKLELYQRTIVLPLTADLTRMYINGPRDGILFYDTYRAQRGTVRKKFCLEEKSAVTPSFLIDLPFLGTARAHDPAVVIGGY